MDGSRARIGLVVPANNTVIEPELRSVAPEGVAFRAARIPASGDLTRDAVLRMEGAVDRAVDDLSSSGVDLIAYADMVTTFVMEPGWNEARAGDVAARTGIPCVTAWTAMRDALAALGLSRFALGTPYPAAIHALARPFFEAEGYRVDRDATLDILAMSDVPKVTEERLAAFSRELAPEAALVLLATDLPTFGVVERLEAALRVPVLTSNQTLLRTALRAAGIADPIPGLGRAGRI